MGKYKLRFINVIIIVMGIFFITVQANSAQSLNNLIVFMSDRDGNREIYTMNPDGSDIQRLTRNNAQDLHPSWSPDKTRITFISNRDGNFALYVMDANGNNQRRISDDEFAYHEYPTWSPDGRHIAYSSDRAGSLDIYIVEANGNNPRRLTTGNTDETEPAWSPDGRQIAYLQQVDGAFEIFLVNANGGTPQLLTQGNGDDHFSPSWSPDGTQLAYALTVFDQAGNNSEIYIRNINTGEERLLISRENSFIQGLSWSEDGNDIIYQVRTGRGGNWTIHRVSIQDGTFEVLTDQSYNSESPSWFTPFLENRINLPDLPDLSCPGLPDAIVAVGDRARVTFSPPFSNNVRNEPRTNARLVTQIDPGGQFNIIDGPECAGGYRWWRIRLDNSTTGWTTDGDRNDRWIEPVN